MVWIAALYLCSMIYSAVRYVVFMPDNLANLPVFVLNKGISMAAALCFAIAFCQQWRRQRRAAVTVEPITWFRAGVVGVVAHIPMSLAILRPSYFREFFAGDRLSLNGEAVFLFGALTAGGIHLLTRTNWTPLHRWWLSLATMSLLFSHTLFMGIARGLNINRSHAYLPPMWLLSLIGIAMGLGFVLMSRPRDADRAGPGAVSERERQSVVR
jgi:hypothetical protein